MIEVVWEIESEEEEDTCGRVRSGSGRRKG